MVAGVEADVFRGDHEVRGAVRGDKTGRGGQVGAIRQAGKVVRGVQAGR